MVITTIGSKETLHSIARFKKLNEFYDVDTALLTTVTTVTTRPTIGTSSKET